MLRVPCVRTLSSTLLLVHSRFLRVFCPVFLVAPAYRPLSLSLSFLPFFFFSHFSPSSTPPPLFSAPLSPVSSFSFFPPGVHSRKIPRLVIRRSFSSLSPSLPFSLSLSVRLFRSVVRARAESNRQPVGEIQLNRATSRRSRR